ncbi:RDD family protein [Luteimicrobium xylanilyticum]|uniref:RDD domain-containing protein n=1 Tax=Luteimicrobium xylanilyticum TaxID=1133546 RepID=A0A5P9QF31_9MICO|nr:RDD family protein [Luteimicrobium xylanilyticum]QFU99045.1 hypothetical protein KDY119_02571 [Luteimicrobium xylanilyticum]
MEAPADGVLIGEAVVLETRPASFASRMLAGLLDLLVLGVLAIAGLIVIGELATDASAPAYGIALLVVLLVGVPTTVETLSRGRSLGKLAVGTRVVRDDGGPVRFRQAFVRALVGVVEIWATVGSIALIVSLCNAQGKRAGDYLAGTYVLRVRGGPALAPLPPVPPALVAWVRTADVARLPDGLALAARQFLGRAARMAPASRARVGTDLAARVERFVAPGPPWGTPPEAFLTAVLAERREREHSAAARAAQTQRELAARVVRLPFEVPDPRR